MSTRDLKNADTERRLIRAMWRDRIRMVLSTTGVAFACLGVLLALLPFGPALSNPVIIPKADPNAGIAVLQSLASETGRKIGLGLGLIGAVLFLFSVLVDSRGSQDDDNKRF